MFIVRAVFLGSLLACAGCDAFSPAPDELRRPAIIDLNEQPVVISIPDTVSVGASFEVRVRSYGTGCRSVGETPTAVQGLIAQVAPFDLEQTSGTCTPAVQIFEHTTTISFATAGTAQVLVLGVREPEHERVTIHEDVVVR